MAAVGAGLRVQLRARKHSYTVSATLRSVDNRKGAARENVLCFVVQIQYERVWVRDVQ